MPASSDLDVCNQAIRLISGDAMDAIDETTPAGSYCAAEYPTAKAWILGKYRWSFASTIGQLTQLTTLPAGCPEAYAYAVPPDLIGVIHAGRSAASRQSSRVRLERINGAIGGVNTPYYASDSPSAWAEYTGNVPEVNWPDHFITLVKTAFAAGLAGSVGQNQKLAQMLFVTAWGNPQLNGDGGLYLASRTEDARQAPQRQAYQPWDDGPLVGVRYLYDAYGSPWSGPFVIPPGVTGPITFIDFNEDQG